MNFDSQTFREAVSNFGPAVFSAPSDEFRRWLQEKRLPDGLNHLMLENALAEHVESPGGGGGLWTPEDIMVLNDQEAAILAGGLLAIGNAPNGDFIVIDFR